MESLSILLGNRREVSRKVHEGSAAPEKAALGTDTARPCNPGQSQQILLQDHTLLSPPSREEVHVATRAENLS